MMNALVVNDADYRMQQERARNQNQRGPAAAEASGAFHTRTAETSIFFRGRLSRHNFFVRRGWGEGGGNPRQLHTLVISTFNAFVDVTRSKATEHNFMFHASNGSLSKQ